MSWLRLGLILAALVVAVVPLPSRLVEAWYSRGIYPVLQASITPLSNLVPVALLDLTGLVLVAALGFGFWRRVRAAGIVRALTSGVVTLLTLTAVVFLLFVVLWGLNYRRLPLDQKIVYDRSRVTREAALRLGDFALREVNGLHASAHGPEYEPAGASARQSAAGARDGVCVGAADARQRASGGAGSTETISARTLLSRRRDRRHDRSVLPRNHPESQTPCRSNVPSC